MHAVCSRSRNNTQTRLFTVRIRRLTIRQAHIALLLEVSTCSKLPRSEGSEAKVGSSTYEGNDNHGQAEGQQELGKHVGSHCWGGVGVVRHFGELCSETRKTVPDCLFCECDWRKAGIWHTYADLFSSRRQRPLFLKGRTCQRTKLWRQGLDTA
jgi:hypothetical protein